MAWPPPTLTITRTNTTVMTDTHPADHNNVNQAVNDLVRCTAWGYLASVGQSADFGNGGVATEQPMLISPAAPFVEGRRIRIVVALTYKSTVAGDVFQFAIRAGTGITGNVLRLNKLTVGGATEGDKLLHFETHAGVMTAAAGSPTQWVFTVSRISGTGNIVFYGSNAQSNSITVYDIGPSGGR